MTNEEAIAVLEEQSNFFRGFQHYFESKSVEISAEKLNAPKLAADRYRKLANAFDAGISALQSVGKDITVPTKDDHFPNITKMVPLTIEELRKMDGQPVWVQTPGIEKYGRWVIVAGVDTDNGQKTLYCQGDYTCRNYGKTWEAYAYPPAHIDREAWKPCADCKPHCAICANYGGWDRYGKPKVCKDCKEHLNFQADDNFCSYCGRPLTEEAWAELEKRLRG